MAWAGNLVAFFRLPYSVERFWKKKFSLESNGNGPPSKKNLEHTLFFSSRPTPSPQSLAQSVVAPPTSPSSTSRGKKSCHTLAACCPINPSARPYARSRGMGQSRDTITVTVVFVVLVLKQANNLLSLSLSQTIKVKTNVCNRNPRNLNDAFSKINRETASAPGREHPGEEASAVVRHVPQGRR